MRLSGAISVVNLFLQQIHSKCCRLQCANGNFHFMFLSYFFGVSPILCLLFVSYFFYFNFVMLSLAIYLLCILTNNSTWVFVQWMRELIDNQIGFTTFVQCGHRYAHISHFKVTRYECELQNTKEILCSVVMITSPWKLIDDGDWTQVESVGQRRRFVLCECRF